MHLAAHYHAAKLNLSKARSRAGAHIFFSNDEPKPLYNVPILTIAQIIKFVMYSSAEAELAAIFITAKDMAPLRQTIIEMKWPQGQYPIQTGNSTAVGVTNNSIFPTLTKYMDMRFHWLCWRMVQGQFRFYWAPSTKNLRYYSTNHNPPLYHLSHRPAHSG